jgi:superfamily II DNA/RNA helicase
VATQPASTASTSAFARLGVSAELVEALARTGITTPFPVQSLTIPDALAGRDVCGKARTGSGKTLAFGLPLLERTAKSQPRRPGSLVLVPTRELAGQIADNLAPLAAVRRIRVAAIFGGVSLYRQAAILRTGIDIVIATPGRLNDLIERGAITVDDVRIAVLDEADQMADLGFMPQVERILNRIQQPHQTMLFSATLDGAVERLVRRYQHDPVFHEVVGPEEDIPAMKHRFIAVAPGEKVGVAASIAAGPQRTLLFVRTQRAADRLARQLGQAGVAANMLHGGLSQPRRERALRAFANGTAPVLVATNIAARGIHVDGVDTVVHHDPPEDAKTYLHRSGRTARAGATGLVVTLVEPDQVGAINALRRAAGLREPVVAMAPDDGRLADLAAWTPTLDDHPARPLPDAGRNQFQRNFHPGRPGGQGGYRQRRPNDWQGLRRENDGRTPGTMGNIARARQMSAGSSYGTIEPAGGRN